MNAPQPQRIPKEAGLEASLEAHLRKKVRESLGGMLVKLAPTVRGVPDRMVLLPGGRILLVELKTSVGRPSAIQAHWHERAANLGTHVHVLFGRHEIDAWVREVASFHDPKPRRRRSAKEAEKAAELGEI